MPVAAKVRIMAPNGEIIEQEAAIALWGDAVVKVPIPNPELWWPNGYGGQPLYQVEISLTL